MIVAVTSPSFSKNQALKEELNTYFRHTVLNEDGIRFDRDQLKSFLKDADGAIIGLELIDEEILDSCPKLKIISKYGVGLNNLDLEACKARNIKVGVIEGVNRLSVAEMTLGFMLGLSRNLFSTSFNLKNGVWIKNGGTQLTGKTIGIIGVGHIGKEVVRLLKPFNCNILVNDIIDQSDYYKIHDLKETTKEDIFKRAEIISIHTPLTDKTTYMVNQKTLDLMRPCAFIINTARGKIVNQNDLKEALMTNKIAGAALDVYEDEPPEDMELLKLNNFVCTPHIGGNAHEAVLAMGRSSISHLKEFFRR